jgi:uncharacterized protein YkwD
VAKADIGTLAVENIYALPKSTAQSAFNWWMNDPTNRGNILNANVTEFGIAYELQKTACWAATLWSSCTDHSSTVFLDKSPTLM